MRRFIIVNKSMPDYAIGEGVEWSNGEVSGKFSYTEPPLKEWPNIKALDMSSVRILWIDPVDAAPYPVKMRRGDGPWEDAVRPPAHRLQDGWGEPNGVVDKHGVPLHVGQQVRLLTGGYEGCGDVGEITSFMINEQGKLRICLAGVNICNMADVNLDEIDAIEKDTKSTAARYDGRKPSWGFSPTITLGKEDK